MRKCLLAIITIFTIMLFCSPAGAEQLEAHIVADCDVIVSLPSDWLYFDRNSDESSPYLQHGNTTLESNMDLLYEKNIYFFAQSDITGHSLKLQISDYEESDYSDEVIKY